MASVAGTGGGPRSLFEAERPLSFVQWAAIIGSIGVLFWSIPGLFVNPDFSAGDAATAERVMGVDMNGWHAVSGFLVAIPALFSALRREWAGPVVIASGAALTATGIWALIDAHVAGGLFYLPNGGTDALLHFGVAAIFFAGGAHYYLVERRRATAAA